MPKDRVRRKGGRYPGGSPPVTAVAADETGRIFDVEGYAAVGMSGNDLKPLAAADTIPLPYGAELMLLPGRSPVFMNLSTGEIEVVRRNPFDSRRLIFPVAAFNSPGYVNGAISAYVENDPDHFLPLFSYGAVGWTNGGFRTAGILVDPEPRQDLRRMRMEKVHEGIREMRRRLPSNRLRKHLERCATQYGCPAGKNFFLGRYEAPLPTSRACNARCLGCISLQQGEAIPCSQNRIDFTPTPEEIADIAVMHIGRVKASVVSFGQGCEGDPLLAAEVIGPAIRLIRSRTSSGTINLNTNGSLPDVMEGLFIAGLDSVRISMNSVRPACYHAYFRPVGYDFGAVVESIDRALRRGRFVSINYLNSPGFTDTPEETGALKDFRKAHPIHMIQWRNLNFDPVKYWNVMNRAEASGPPVGMKRAIGMMRTGFPDLMHGYFNPPKEKWSARS